MISERGFTALIEAIYDAGVDFQGWPKALRLMAQAFHALAVLFGCNSPHLEEVFVIAPQVDQIQRERYASYYHRIKEVDRHEADGPKAVIDISCDEAASISIRGPECALRHFAGDGA